MQRHIAIPFLFVLLALAHIGSLLASSQPDYHVIELQIESQQPQLDLNTGAEESESKEAGGLPDEVVSRWDDQVLEWDQLTRCIRGSETGNAIERWLDCLDSIEEIPASESPALEPLVPLETEQSIEITCSDPQVNGLVEVTEDTMGPFDPLSDFSAETNPSGSSDRGIQGLGPTTEDSTPRSAQDGSSGESRNLSDDQGSDSGSGASSVRLSLGDEIMGALVSPDSELAESMELSSSQISSLDNRLPGEGDTGDATVVRKSSSKWGTDISSVSGDSQPLQSSVCNEDVGCLEAPTEALSSTASIKRSQNLMDALKLAACLGAAVTFLWRRKGRLPDFGKEEQSLLRERAVEYPCPSATGFSMTGLSSSNSDVNYPNVKAGSLSTPLGMAIATVMAEALEQDHSQKAPRTADELSKLLEAAMTESLSPVMGSECPGFVEQFKQSFRSTYRLLGIVRNASGRNSAPPFSSYRRDVSQRRSEGPSRRYQRRADDEEGDNSGLTSSSMGAFLEPVFESDFTPQTREDLDVETDLANRLSKLTFTGKSSAESAAKSGHPGTRVGTQGGASDGENSSHIDQEVFGEIDDVSSLLRREISEGGSEKGTGDGVSQVYQNGVRSRWGRGGLAQLANVWEGEGVGSQSASQQLPRHQGGNSLESGDLDLAMQPFGVTSSFHLVAASESVLSQHEGQQTRYQQRMIALKEQEMHLKKMELAYKFRDLHLKEETLHLSSESNSLMRESVDLSRNKVDFKEAVYQDRKLTAAHTEFVKRCADEMVAGLCVMLCALFLVPGNTPTIGLWMLSLLVNPPSMSQAIRMFQASTKL